MRAIREGSAKRVLSLLEDMAENKAEDYATFWTEFGQVLKEGTGEDAANRERIARLLRFASTHDGEQAQTVSFADYVGRMKDGQDKIYYVTADTFTAAANSPHLEIFRKKGIEVLLLSDRVDEWMLSYLREFDGKSLVSVAKGGLDLAELADEEEKKRQSEVAETFKAAGRAPAAGAGRAGEGGAGDAAPGGFAGLRGGGPERAQPASAAHAEGGGPGGAGGQAGAGDQPGPRADRADPRCQRCGVRRLGRAAAGPGAAGRRRADRRPGGLREALERVAVEGLRMRSIKGRRIPAQGADTVLARRH